MTPLFLTDLLAGLGFGQQVVLAAMAGFFVWYAFKALRIGRAFGSLVESVIKYGMAVVTFVAVGIFFGWVNPGLLLADLLAGGAAGVDMAGRVLGMAWDWLLGVL